MALRQVLLLDSRPPWCEIPGSPGRIAWRTLESRGVSTPEWWQRGAIYQIYPRSFADSDGDGVGDIGGIRAHLDHLSELGVEAVWLSPIYPSPLADFGYDVSDLCDVD